MQTADIFKGKLGHIPRKLKNVASLFFVDGPYILPLKEGDEFQLRTWYHRDEAANLVDDKSLNYSLEYLEEIWNRNGPFEGIIGFSMGGTMATLIASKPNVFKTLKFVIVAGAPNIQVPPFSNKYSNIYIPSDVKR
jgi:hypothetical protein